MRIVRIRTLMGPNVWAGRPLLAMELDLEDQAELRSDEAEGLADRLLAALPGLDEHRCSLGRRSGFTDRLRKGTYLGHVVEHVALELGGLAGMKADFGRTRYAGRPGVYTVAVEFESETAMRETLRVAVEFVEAVLCGAEYPLDGRIAVLRDLADRTRLGPSTRAIADAATERGIPWWRLNDDSLLQLGYGSRRRLVQAAIADTTKSIAVEVAGDKQLTKDLLADAGVPVPAGYLARTPEEAVAGLADLTAPLVVKPASGCKGRGVSLDLVTPEQVRAAAEAALRHSGAIVVEEQIAGECYRMLVIGGRLVAAALRAPAHVVGDGTSTVERLIELTNADPRRGAGHEKPLTRITVDETALRHLAAQGLRLTSVPEAGRIVTVRAEASLSTGATAADVTDLVHPAVVAVCERAARLVGLDVCGLDVVTPDIAATPRPGRFGVLELNAAPGLRMHERPSHGTPRRAGRAIVDMMFPPGDDGRIPIVAVTGTNGKTTTTRMVTHILARTGRTVGAATTHGIHIGATQIAEGDCSGPLSARTLLRDPAVEVAVLETARGGIMRRGLAYDWSDVGVVTNVDLDHIGQDGIEDVEDLVRVKSVVAERVRAGGTVVLSADNVAAAGIAERPAIRQLPRQIVYFSVQPGNPLVAAHLARGGRAYVVRGEVLCEADGSGTRPVIDVAAMPVSLHGTARFQIANALAAIAACRAIGVPLELCASALADFQPYRDNPGRLCHYTTPLGDLIVDFGHNPGAYQAVADLAHRWPTTRTTAIIELPGDRDDSVITATAAAVAGRFTRLIIRESADLRGRPAGEVAYKLHAAIRAADPRQHCEVELDERQALRRALVEQEPGELILACYDNPPLVAEVLREYGITEPVPLRREVRRPNRPGRVSANHRLVSFLDSGGPV